MKKISEEEILKNIDKFSHKYSSQVRFNEVDSMKVVHNVQYFNILEFARIKYLEAIGIDVNRKTFTSENLIFTVHHELDYYFPLYFFDTYDVYSRTVSVKNTSLVFENIILDKDKKVIVRSNTVLVYVDSKDLQPMRVPDDVREKILIFEGENCIFLD